MRKLGWIGVEVVLALASEVSAQVDTAWVRILDEHSQGVSQPISLIVDSQGNSYTCSNSIGEDGRSDIVVIKWDPDGQILWNYRSIEEVPEGASQLHLANDSVLVIVGFRRTTTGGDDWRVISLSNSGDLLWDRVIDWSHGRDDRARGIVSDEYGHMYITGFCTEAETGRDILLAKLMSDGTDGWNIRFPDARYRFASGLGGADEGTHVEISTSGVVYIAGFMEHRRWIVQNYFGDPFFHYFIASVDVIGNERWSYLHSVAGPLYAPNAGLVIDDFDHASLTGTLAGFLSDQVHTLSFSQSGLIEWEHGYNREGNLVDRGRAIAKGQSGEIIVVGESETLRSNGGWDFVIIKYQSTRVPTWVRHYNSQFGLNDGALAVALNSQGSIAVTGWSRTSPNKFDIVTLQYAQDGSLLWEHRLEKDADRGDAPYGIAYDNAGDLIVLGKFGESIGLMKYALPKSVTSDILPNSCPNIINTGVIELDYPGIRPGAAAASRPTVPVAILGSKSFDVSRVDPSTIQIVGLSPLSHRLMDVSRPVEPRETECECTRAGADGYTDLILYFDQEQFVAALGPVNDGEVRTLAVTGKTKTGVPLSGSDCVTIREGPIRISPMASAGEKVETGFAAYPNPFNAATLVSFALATESEVRLDVYDVLGHRVATLVSDMMPVGEHQVSWNAAGCASGVYFARLATSAGMMTRKLVLVR